MCPDISAPATHLLHHKGRRSSERVLRFSSPGSPSPAPPPSGINTHSEFKHDQFCAALRNKRNRFDNFALTDWRGIGGGGLQTGNEEDIQRVERPKTGRQSIPKKKEPMKVLREAPAH